MLKRRYQESQRSRQIIRTIEFGLRYRYDEYSMNSKSILEILFQLYKRMPMHPRLNVCRKYPWTKVICIGRPWPEIEFADTRIVSKELSFYVYPFLLHWIEFYFPLAHLCDDTSKILLATRSCFGHTSIDYTYQINILFNQHKVEIRGIVYFSYINIHKAFFSSRDMNYYRLIPNKISIR